MNKTDATFDLDQLILNLEREHQAEGLLLKNDFRDAVGHFQPANLVTSTLKELSNKPGIQADLAQAAIGLATSFLVKKLQSLTTDNPIVQVFRKVLETATNGSRENVSQNKSA